MEPAPDVVERRAARVLLIVEDAVLLIQGQDPGRPDLGPWWHTPGGGIEAGETEVAAAAREVGEETGLALGPDQLGSCIATRTTTFEFEGLEYHQREWFFAARVGAFTPHARGWDDIEQRSLLAYRWWTLAELRGTDAVVYPRDLAAVLEAVLAGPVDPPMVLSGDEG